MSVLSRQSISLRQRVWCERAGAMLCVGNHCRGASTRLSPRHFIINCVRLINMFCHSMWMCIVPFLSVPFLSHFIEIYTYTIYLKKSRKKRITDTLSLLHERTGPFSLLILLCALHSCFDFNLGFVYATFCLVVHRFLSSWRARASTRTQLKHKCVA